MPSPPVQTSGPGTFFQFTMAGALTPLYSFGATDSDAASLHIGPEVTEMTNREIADL